ncbi:MAG: hypothetical protein KGV59_06295 [Tenacibaculum sp.]|nr:hypothetical protein [Tenacibaculum sp.]
MTKFITISKCLNCGVNWEVEGFMTLEDQMYCSNRCKDLYENKDKSKFKRLNKEDYITLVFKAKDREDIKLDVTLEQFIDNIDPIDILFETYECTESSCQVNGFCECFEYEDYEFSHILINLNK